MAFLSRVFFFACVFCVFSCFGTGAASAAAPQPWAAMAHISFRNHTDPNISGAITMVQDKDGFLWLGTQMGLLRWDGQRMRRHIADPGRADALPDNYVLSLHIADNGNLWIGTSAAGLVRYDPERESFVRAARLRNVRVSALADDGAGGLWVGTGASLERIAADGTVRPVGAGAPQTDGPTFADTGVDQLRRDRHGGLWVGTRRGLWYRGTANAPLERVPLVAAGARQPAITAIVEDHAGRLWIGSRVHGAFMIASRGAKPVAVVESPTGGTLDGERVFSIVEKSDGVMWLGMEAGGIIEIDVAAARTRRIRHRPDIPDTLRDDDPMSMLRTREGQVFVSTVDALSQHDPRPQGVLTIRTMPGVEKLSVPALLARPDGQVWMGLTAGAIARVDPVAGMLGTISVAGRPGGPGLPKGSILALANGPHTTVFIGTQQGLYAVDGDGRHVRRIAIPERPAEAPVYALAARAGVLYVGGLDGIWVIAAPDSEAPRLLRHEDSALGDRRITAILPMPDGDVWVGTRAGLARMKASGSGAEVMPTSAVDATRLPNGYITSLHADPRGRLWVTNFSSGVAVLQRTDADGRRWFRRFGTADGLPANGVSAMVADGAGGLWFSTDNGLARIDTASFAIRRIGSADGANMAAFWTAAGVRDTRGHLLFGGLNGVNVLRPARLVTARGTPSLVVTQLSLGGREMPAWPFNRHAGPVMPLAITPAQRERGLSVEFAALDFGLAAERRYAYRLDGFDPDWIDTDPTIRRANYTNLPPGNYTLRLRSTLADGSGAVAADFPVNVEPAWHEQTVVRMLEGALVVAAIALVMRARTSLLRKRQVELETLVAARTSELRAIQARLETMAYADALTGLPNRRLFNDELRRMAAQCERDGEPFGLLLIDLDKFKAVNDSLGHDAGDALLVSAAQRLPQAVRATDKVVRLGGDEFAVLLAARVDGAAIAEICERIVAAMAQPVSFKAHSLQISASVGATIFTPGVSDVEAIYKAADVALYRSKQAGRNGWMLSDAG